MLRLAIVLSGVVLIGTAWADEKKAPSTGVLPTMKFPGKSFSGELPAFTPDELALAKLLKADVIQLATQIGERNVAHPQALAAAAVWLEKELEAAGFRVERQKYDVDGVESLNLIVEVKGAQAPSEIVLVGAHYDSAPGTPGANDNGSGTAACLALTRRSAKLKPDRTLRFVFFANEEPPHFQRQTMGSLVYARSCKARRDDLHAVLVLETLGYYTDAAGSQKYPSLMSAYYPSVGNFVGFVGNVQSTPLVTSVVTSFRKNCQFPSEAGALPGQIKGVDWSDHWSFWQFGYQAVMVSDTATFRYPHYHRATDTPDKLQFDRLARVTLGLEKVVAELCQTAPAEAPKSLAKPSLKKTPSAAKD